MTASWTELSFRSLICCFLADAVSANRKQMNLCILCSISNAQGIWIIPIEYNMTCKICSNFLNLADNRFHFSSTIKLITEEVGNNKMSWMQILKLPVQCQLIHFNHTGIGLYVVAGI